jgi:hypothetical protein
MAVPEVRQHRYAHIEEVCTRYDWDGVELDWQRHGFHLPQDEGYRLRYVLTDLQRAVRRLTRGLSRQRGRPFYLAARVATTPETCLRLGYDIPLWVEEGLVDILIPAGGAATDPSPDVAGFADLCRGRDIAVYPGFDGGLPDPWVGPEDPQTKDHLRTRAIACRHHRTGADGIYVFNWHASRDSRRDLLTQVGALETLRHQDKIYAATHRFRQHAGPWRGAYQNDRVRGQVPVPLKPTLMGTGPVIPLEVGDDLAADAPAEVELRLRLDQWVRGDEVQVKWNGAGLPNPEIRYDTSADPHRISSVSDAAWLCWKLDPAGVSLGPNRVEAILKKRHPQLACDLVLTDMELVIRYT